VFPAVLLALPAFLAACATPTREYLAEQSSFRVVPGFVISLTDLHDPVVEKLKDGVAYTVTQPGCVVVFENERRERTTWELEPGDRFVNSRPYSYVLLAPRSAAGVPARVE